MGDGGACGLSKMASSSSKIPPRSGGCGGGDGGMVGVFNKESPNIVVSMCPSFSSPK